jgi:hypothetical protein
MQVAGMREADMGIVGMKVSRGAKSDREQNLKKRASRAIDLRRSIAKIAFARPNLIKSGSKFEQIWSILAICEVQT